MELDRTVVRKKWEELMKKPLAKELWVTEPENFDDPTYHPLLRLVIDSDDVTVINVDEFEAMYSDEESNYWNGVKAIKRKSCRGRACCGWGEWFYFLE